MVKLKESPNNMPGVLELALEGIDIDTKDVTNVATLSRNPTST